ncbi:MAG: biopolymer transporter ExbD [Planctomycetes bacterium]|nr:biopolymer transporter ExbD [Planctomycetota bacterium]
MRVPHSSTMQRDFSVSMTPMIDVVFLLLIFFVCTASFQIPEAILPSPLELSGTTAATMPPELAEPELERVLIAIAQHGEKILLTVNGQNCPTLTRLSELLEALAGVESTLPILLDIAGETPLGTAIDVYDRCRLAGFAKIQFVAEVSR